MKNIIYLIAVLMLTWNCSDAQKQISDMENFEKISWQDLNDNAIRMIGKDWMLIAAGSVETDYNMMTAAWGGLGWLWEKPVSFIYVRPQRHTHNFTKREDY
ncbi:MAG: hypothetical protein RBR64_01800, partial [Bacteroidales bacterium]|nr:hypothetical protein [Bacteroidales bacterium]